MKRTTLLETAVLLATLAGGAFHLVAQDFAGSTTTVTAVTGTITQLNYGVGGKVDGFLIGTDTLLSLPSNICGGIESLGAAGNSVTYSGSARTASSGFESVRVTSFTNNTTKATYTRASFTQAAYGPTSGTVKQLNYDSNGSINGFLFTPSGSSTVVFVFTGSRGSNTLKPILTVDATVSVTGTTVTSAPSTACTVAGALTAVDASSLTIGSQTIVISGGGHGQGGGYNDGHH